LDVLWDHEPVFDATEKHGTGKSREPADWKVCATGKVHGEVIPADMEAAIDKCNGFAALEVSPNLRPSASICGYGLNQLHGSGLAKSRNYDDDKTF
jgi:hypothetical protein